ncbi:MAG: peptidase M15, partial [Pseudaminobacter sp.]
ASAADSKPERKPVVVAAQPQAARWVLHTDYVKNASAGTKAPSFAYNLVRTAPREVYTAGFQAGDQMADANRFSGKAVEFLSVARF